VSVLILRSSVVASVVASALNFPGNGQANSNIQLQWLSLPRQTHTAIWKVQHDSQPSPTYGFYATAWHVRTDNNFAGGNDAYGTHPYPCNGTVLGPPDDGHANGSILEVDQHFFEMAGFSGKDFIATTQSGPTFEVEKDRWYTQARVCELIIDDTVMQHTFYPDLANTDTFIRQTMAVAALAGETLKFLFGCSPWLGDGNANTTDVAVETLCGMLRGIQLYGTGLSLAQIQARMDLTTDADVISNDPGSLYYSNLNPTHTDVTDKSGNGNHGAWENSNRPTTVTL
jgi:hypothetical protein